MRKIKEESLEDQVKERAKKPRAFPKIELIPSGCDVLDVHIGGGFPLGGVVNLAGKPSTAKTLLLLMLIMKCLQKYRDKFKWRYDDVEHRMLFDTDEMFGYSIYGKNMVHSKTVEEFNYNFTKFCESLEPDEKGVYIVDSLDMLPSQSDIKRSEEEFKTIDSGKTFEKGTYGKGKQLYLSANFFNQKAGMARDHNCTLIFVSQLRANFDAVFGEKYKKGGGYALDHQNSLEIWLYKKSDIKIEKDIRGIKRTEKKGAEIEAKVKKNSITGLRSQCHFSVLNDLGIDNVTSNIDYLYGLKKDNGTRGRFPVVKWDGKEFKKRNSLIQYIEENNQEDILIREIWKLRQEILDAMESKERKKNKIDYQ